MSERGMAQRELALTLGVSLKAVSNWITGKAEPRGANLRKLETVLGGHLGETDEDRVLREIDDGRLWAEATRRFFRQAAVPTLDPSRLAGRGRWATSDGPTAQDETSTDDDGDAETTGA